jgi:PAS domain S-box-containing protein
MWKGRSPFTRHARMNKVTLGVASLILIALVSLSYRQWDEYRRANAEMEHSSEVTTAINGILTGLVDAEAGQRGFLLTGENRYLEPYNRGVQEVPKNLATLKALLSANREAMGEFQELDSLTRSKLNELRQTIETRRTRGDKAAVDIVVAGEGQREMDSIRALCAQMEREQNTNQARASAEGETAAGITVLILVAGSLVLLFFFAFALEPFASPDPHAWNRPWFLRYGAAVLAVAAITLVRAALTPLGGPIAMPFTLYFCAVAFAGWYGGFRPTLLSIVLSLLAGSWFFAAPTGSFLVSGHDDQVAMVMIVLVGFGIALLSRSQRNAVERAVLAENSERAERRRFETTLASIGDAVIATDARQRITFVNRVASALLQWPDAEARGKSLREVFRIVNEFTRAAVEIPVDRVLREGQVVERANQTVLLGRNGAEVPIDDSVAPIRDDSGNIQGTVLVFRDVTERRRTEKRLAEQALLLERAAAEARSQRQRLGLALTAGKMGVYEVDSERTTLWWSPETYALFGVNPAEFKPSRDSFAALIHPGNREIFMQHWDENIAAFQPINREFRILKPDGKERWISCRGTATYDDAGSPIRYSGLFLDITERREAEQVLRKFEKLSAAARLSAAIAHEINNPLGAVSNLIYLAKEGSGVPHSTVEMLVRAEHELERVAHAARQALGFYRESSKTEAIDIAELIDSVVRIYSTRIAEKKIKLVRGYLECGPVNGVRGELRQVFSNLITNAIEAVKQGGTIWLGAQSAGSGKEQSIEITIADDGGGIAAEHVDQIFEPFFTTKAGTGTGLGLWVAKEIIERHRGIISLHQTNGKDGQGGATFKIRLPGATVLRASNSAVKAASPAGKAQEEPSQSVEAGNF